MRNQGLAITVCVIVGYLAIWQILFLDLPLHVSIAITVVEIMLGVWLGKRMAGN